MAECRIDGLGVLSLVCQGQAAIAQIGGDGPGLAQLARQPLGFKVVVHGRGVSALFRLGHA